MTVYLVFHKKRGALMGVYATEVAANDAVKIFLAAHELLRQSKDENQYNVIKTTVEGEVK